MKNKNSLANVVPIQWFKVIHDIYILLTILKKMTILVILFLNLYPTVYHV